MGKNHQDRSKHKNKRQQQQGNRQYTKKGGDSWKKKGRHEERRNKNQPSHNIAAEIEEQLRRQREQQRQKAPEVKEHSTEQPKRNLGSYFYDEERQAYFPRDQLLKRRRQNNANDSFARLPRNRSFPHRTIWPKQNCRVSLPYQSSASGLNFYKALMCSSPSARQALLSEWTGRRRILEQTWNIQDWYKHAVINLRNWGSPSWCRTFDVLDRRTSDGDSSFPVFLNIFDGNAYLSSVFCTYPNDHDHFPPSGHYYSGRFLPGRFERENFAVVLESSPDNDKSYLSAVPIPHDNTLVPALSDILFSTVYPVQVNDVLRMHHSKKLVVVANYDNTYQARPWLDGEICTASDRCLNFPKSDVLCVQALCPEQLQHDIAVMGHRNGQTTIYDPRCTDAYTVTAPDRSGLGNVVQLHCDFSPNCFVARGGNHGTCRLFDIRQGSGGGGCSISNSFADKYHDPMLVHDFVFPADTNLKRTARCRGAATVLEGNVLLIPYFKKSDSISTEEGHLGVWCLHSGSFLGSKQVTTAKSDDSSWIELCPTLTHLWEPDSTDVSSQETRQSNAARRIPGVGGFWMRCWNRENSQLVCVGINDLLS